MDVTVVINTLDRADHLRSALASLRGQRHRAFEVVVVNGPSTDDTEAVLREHPWVRAARCDVANLSVSRNVGIAASASEVVAFLDDDAQARPSWLERLVTGYTDPDVGCVGGALRDHTGVAFQARATACDVFGASRDVTAAVRAKGGSHEAQTDHYLSPTGANCSFRRSALVAVGGFDETYAYFLDETDVVFRLWRAGWRTRFVLGAEVLHKYASSAQRDAARVPQTLFEQAKSKAYFLGRNAAPLTSARAVAEAEAAYAEGIVRDVEGHRCAGRLDRADADRLTGEVAAGLAKGAELARGPARCRDLGEAPRSWPSGAAPLPDWRPPGERLRVAFVARELGTAGGRAVHRTARALAGRGHEVTLITRGRDVHTLDLEDGVWVARLPCGPVPRHRRRAVEDAPRRDARWVAAVMDETNRLHALEGFDVVVTSEGDEAAAALQRTDPSFLVRRFGSAKDEPEDRDAERLEASVRTALASRARPGPRRATAL